MSCEKAFGVRGKRSLLGSHSCEEAACRGVDVIIRDREQDEGNEGCASFDDDDDVRHVVREGRRLFVCPPSIASFRRVR